MRDDVVDIADRRRALDVGRSFIVRAPAGSGKTRLLIQRYMALLATVDEPEEVVAITFTRKAAAEMRRRVLDALVQAADDRATDGGDEVRALAHAVLQRQMLRGWNLMENTARLRIQTIDALNATLVRQMPVLSRFGAQPQSVEDASPLYAAAARALIGEVEDGGQVADDLATLLRHLDNDAGMLERLLIDMLCFRDQWLRNLPRMDQRVTLEAALAGVWRRAAKELAARFPASETAETLELARFAASQLAGVSALSVFVDRESFPGGNEGDITAWRGIAQLLLTGDDAWRKPGGIDARHGFPAGKTKEAKALFAPAKARMQALLMRLTGEEGLRAALARVRVLPPVRYTDTAWQVLGAIVRLLPRATAHLWDAFGRAGQSDFVEMALAAQRALGEDDAPTDLALTLDYRIRHLLVDEFQDTSFAQYLLLARLTRGWSEGDGRTLFVVGDPMQSIYRFREAEVGLFLDAQRHGIGEIGMTALTLRANFRSSAAVIDWVNRSFTQLMPESEAIADGAVPYTPCIAQREQAPPAGGVSLHWVAADDAAGVEAGIVVDAVRAAQQDNPSGSIAILVRFRAHLAAILPALRDAGIVFRAVEIDPLRDRPVVQDLLMILRALRHVDDRIAWLALLRAPWCGMTLNDLVALVGADTPHDGALACEARSIRELMHDDTCIARLSTEGVRRLVDLRDVLEEVLPRVRREPIRDLVERVWLTLRGPATVGDAAALDNAGAFLDLIEEEAGRQTGGGDLHDLEALDRALERLHAARQAVTTGEPPPVEIMTIHKSKGLEFDTVIVPALHRTPPREDRKLIVWDEHPTEQGRAFLLAPIRATGEEDDDIYRYLAGLNRERQRHEDRRLLYVAATRAVRRLHLIASLKRHSGDEACEVATPRDGSLLAVLWPVVAADAAAFAAAVAPPPVVEHHVVAAQRLARQPAQRLRNDLIAPALASTLIRTWPDMGADETAQIAPIDFDWVGHTARHIGTVTHRLLQCVAEEGPAQWNRGRIASMRKAVIRELTGHGVEADALPAAADRVLEALDRTLHDQRGRWVLSSHRDARVEWRLTGLVGGRIASVVIDRTFVDEAGVRWIVDFKTGRHDGADVEGFLDNEQRRYRQQLETYAAVVRALEPEREHVRLALYFPMHGGWREWVAPMMADRTET